MKKYGWIFGILLLFFVGSVSLGYYISIQRNEVQSKLQSLIERASDIDTEMQELKISKRQTEIIKIPILMYHYVEIVTDLNDTLRMSQNIPPQIFESQLTTLLANGYTPLSMTQLVDYFAGQDLPQKPIVITFDDGYQDFYTDVFPILKKYHVKATNYIVSGFVGRDKNYLNLTQLQELASSPLIEIGAHSISHSDLPYLNFTDMQNEIHNSKLQLEFMIKKPVLHFAYPYGRYSADTITMTQNAGYKSAVSTDEEVTQTYANRFNLKRIRPGRFVGDALPNRIQ